MNAQKVLADLARTAPPRGELLGGAAAEALRIAGATETPVDRDRANQLEAEALAVAPPEDWATPSLPSRRTRTTTPAMLEALLRALPSWARAWAGAKAAQMEIDPVLPAMASLSAIAAAVQRKAWLTAASGQKAALTIWGVALAESGGGKSTVLQAAIEPITEWEQEQAEAMREQVVTASAKREAKERDVKRALRAIEQAKPTDDIQAAQADATKLSVELDGMEVPRPPQIVCRAPTSARLAQLLQEQQGRMGLFHAEADLPTLLGLRSRDAAPTDSVLLDAWDGMDTGEERLQREEGLGGDRLIPKAHLTMGIATQPTKLARLLRRNPDLLENGFFGRCLYVLPEDMSDRATFAPRPMPAHVEQAYRTGLRRLLDLAAPDGADIPCVPLSPEADERFVELRKALQLEVRRGGPMHEGALRSWAGRAHSHALHLAGVLHMAEHAPHHLSVPVSSETMDRAARAVLEYFVPTVRETMVLLGASPSARLVDSLVSVLRRFRQDPERNSDRRRRCDARELYRAVGCEPAALAEPLAELVECGVLMPIPPPATRGPGRRASPEYWIHPGFGGEQ